MVVRVVIAFSLLALPGVTSAHVGGIPGQGGVPGGVMHPLVGLDHLLALVAIGLWLAYQESAIQRVVVPLTLMALATGAMAGMAGLSLPGVEAAIVLSVIAFGLLITLRKRLPAWGAGAMAAGFMLFHGAAHGVEMPTGAGETGFVLGLVLASGLVLLFSRALGELVRRVDQPVNQLIGVAFMLSGGFFVMS